MKFFWLSFCIIAGFTDAVLLNVNCNYENYDWDTISPYSCDVQNNINVVLTEGLTINSATGSHDFGMNNNHVTCFYSTDKNFQFFPKNLSNIFNSLEGIIIANAQIKEIHQSDLKAFPKLVHLGLHVNEIEFIEEDLFKFNPSLKIISLRNNKIKEIHSKVFDNLPDLVTLRLIENQCIDKDSNLSSSAVLNVIKYVKLQCTIPEQVNIGMEIKALEKTINHFKLEDYDNNNTENEDNFAKIERQIKNLGLPKNHELSRMLDEVHVVKVPFATSLFNEIYSSNHELSKQVAAIQEDFKGFKEEVSVVFQKILEKFDENSQRINKELTDKITQQNQVISDLNDRMKTLENSINSF